MSAPEDFESMTPKQLEGYKKQLLNVVSASLIKEPRFDASNDLANTIITLVKKIAYFDPEFLMKLALYTRDDLGIRSTSNYMVSVASNITSCQPFVRKYFPNICRLPSDWLDCAATYQVLPDRQLSGNAIPTCLRKAMVDKFPEFDAYQLGKYNKEGSIKRKNKKRKEKEKANPGKAPKFVKSAKPTLTIKQMIRQLHISTPTYNVMCILGKKYPENAEDFSRSGLPGHFESERAGKRMKLPVAETWETMLSEKGNKAQTWEELIEHKKLPFMAMLRNIRNLIMTGVQPRYHRWVQNKLRDENTIANSRQFPFRFFSAYEVIPKDLEEFNQLLEAQNKPLALKDKDGKPIKRRPKKVIHPQVTPTTELFNQYRASLDEAVKLATTHNVKPIRGSTIVFVNGSPNMDKSCDTAKGMGKFSQTREIAALLGLMCKYVCEDCDFRVFGLRSGGAEVGEPVKLKEGTILDNMQVVAEASASIIAGDFFPLTFLENLVKTRTKIDNIVILSNSLLGPGYADQWENARGPHDTITNFLTKYRQEVNPDLLYVSVDLSGRATGIVDGAGSHVNNVMITGFSDSILRFIAERGDSNQLSYVENIDQVKRVKELGTPVPSIPKFNFDWLSDIYSGHKAPEPEPVQPSQLPWRTIRVFISSTFLDMHGERDLLTRHVFPALRERCKKLRINLIDVDLRWGVTEEESQRGSSVKLCLEEVDRCRPFFLGFLGDRYGWAPEDYGMPDEPRWDWVRDYPTRRSVTEMEIEYGALRDDQSQAFFYFRDPVEVPSQYARAFGTENPEAADNLNNLKDRIRDNYRPHRYKAGFRGVVDNKPMVGDLDPLGDKIIEDLWRAILSSNPQDTAPKDALTIERSYHDAFVHSRAKNFIGRRDILEKLNKFADGDQPGVITILGEAGGGKSALVAKWIDNYVKNNPQAYVLYHFVGVAPGSTDILQVLSRLCRELKQAFRFEDVIPADLKELQKTFASLLEQAAFLRKVVVVLDAVNQLDNTNRAHSLDWLPRKTPAKLIVSTLKGPTYDALQLRKPKPPQIEVPQLDPKDRKEIVRVTLAQFRKKLDERPMNDQMRLLLRKTDAHKPLYLVVACEELRMFGVYERLTEYLKGLAATVPRLFEEVLKRLEGDHGHDLLATTLGALAASRGGLLESELHGIVSSHLQLTQQAWSRLYNAISPYLRPPGDDGSGTIDFFHAELAHAVHQRYLRAGGLAQKVHLMLAQYFGQEADPDKNQTWRGSPRAVSELPYHLTQSRHWKDLESCLTNLAFVEAKVRAGKVFDLIGDYVRSCDSGLAFPGQARIRQYWDFVAQNAHVLSERPYLTYQQAANQPDASPVALDAKNLWNKGTAPLTFWLAHINKPQHHDACKRTITGHADPVLACAFSPNGKLLVAASRDTTLKVYDVATGQDIATLRGHSNWVVSCAFSPDGNQIASASWDQSAILWNATHFVEVGRMTLHKRQVNDVKFSPDGRMLATASWDCSVRLWDTVEGRPVGQLKDHTKPVNTCAFSPDSRRLVSASWDGEIKIWMVEHPSELKLVVTMMGHLKSVTGVAFAPNDKHIVTTSLDKTVRLWDSHSGKEITVLGQHAKPALAVAYSPDGQYLVSSADDGTVKFWDAVLGSELGQHNLQQGFLTACAFSPDDERIVVANQDCALVVWDVVEQRVLQTLKGHTRTVTEVAYSPVGGLICSSSEDGTLRLWHEESPDVKFVLEGHSGPVSCCAFSPKGDRVASGSHDFKINLWATVTGMLLQTLSEHTNVVVSVDFSGNGKYIVSASRDSTMKVWNAASGKVVNSLSGQLDWLNSCRFDTDSKRIVTGSWDFNVQIWNVRNGKCLNTLKGHGGSVQRAGFSHDGKYIVSASYDCTLKVWDSRAGTELTTLVGHTERLNGFAFAHDGQRVASVSDDGTLRIWDFLSGTELATLLGHSQPVRSVQFGQSDSLLIASASDDRALKLWDTRAAQDHMAHSDLITCTAFSPDGLTLASASADGTTTLWAAMTGKPLKTIRQPQAVRAVAFARLRPALVLAGDDNLIRSFHTGTRKQLGQPLQGHDNTIRALALSPDEDALASVAWDCKVHIWDSNTGRITRTLTGATDWLEAVVFSPDGRRVAAAGRDGFVRIWRRDQAQPECQAQLGGWVVSLAWSAVGIVAACWDGSAYLFDQSLRLVSSFPHGRPVTSVAFAPNNRHILTVAQDGVLRIWDGQKARVVAEYVQASPLTTLSVSPTSQLIAAGDVLGGIKFLRFIIRKKLNRT